MSVVQSSELHQFDLNHCFFDEETSDRGYRIRIVPSNRAFKDKIIKYISQKMNDRRVIVADPNPIYYNRLNVSDFGELIMSQRAAIDAKLQNSRKYANVETAIHDSHRTIVIEEDVKIDQVYALEERMITATNLGMTVISMTSNPAVSWNKLTDYVFLDAPAIYKNRSAMSYTTMNDLRKFVGGEETNPSDYLKVIEECAMADKTLVIDIQSRELMKL